MSCNVLVKSREGSACNRCQASKFLALVVFHEGKFTFLSTLVSYGARSRVADQERLTHLKVYLRFRLFGRTIMYNMPPSAGVLRE